MKTHKRPCSRNTVKWEETTFSDSMLMSLNNVFTGDVRKEVCIAVQILLTAKSERTILRKGVELCPLYILHHITFYPVLIMLV